MAALILTQVALFNLDCFEFAHNADFTQIHFICPQQAEEALASGITTMLGGGTGPRFVSCTRGVTPQIPLF